ncbi:peptidylprolyl isomerase [Labedella gwakjiensis]|uniref:Peptidyl-prolyl cis-trans isomerase n=1 Tax=Labedella gwakjiensis TaxID=390269 RepID=A0A2P8H014_9MICO|nr:FKBP-type peptidyl-prolyl cis-trans isomerase [Labedella gwakjiensis]PSL39563.1 peptidylprolyl isomerase [Labedella gwakjiensis]RUQ86041.1 peptidylprolyl isomerase [Labedella gwakjiensis]
MRKAPILLLSAGLVALSLTACTSPADACTPEATPGDASNVITADGDFGTAPVVDAPSDVYTTKTQSTTLIEGDGDVVLPDELVVIDYTLVNGRTGEVVTQSAYDASAPTTFSPENLLPGMAKGLVCATAGSRVAVAISAEDAFGPSGGNPQYGIDEDDTILAVMDVHKSYLAKADGFPVPVTTPGLPSVVTAADGTPGLTIPKTDPPADLRKATLLQGSGQTVKEGDLVTVNYTGALWTERTIFDSSWERGTPAQFTTDQVVPGFADALVGAQVGSQVVVVIPPSQGYGDTASGSIPANSTLVFVIDILGVG